MAKDFEEFEVLILIYIRAPSIRKFEQRIKQFLFVKVVISLRCVQLCLFLLLFFFVLVIFIIFALLLAGVFLLLFVFRVTLELILNDLHEVVDLDVWAELLADLKHNSGVLVFSILFLGIYIEVLLYERVYCIDDSWIALHLLPPRSIFKCVHFRVTVVMVRFVRINVTFLMIEYKSQFFAHKLRGKILWH